jgi:hypothetical protein
VLALGTLRQQDAEHSDDDPHHSSRGEPGARAQPIGSLSAASEAASMMPLTFKPTPPVTPRPLFMVRKLRLRTIGASPEGTGTDRMPSLSLLPRGLRADPVSPGSGRLNDAVVDVLRTIRRGAAEVAVPPGRR